MDEDDFLMFQEVVEEDSNEGAHTHNPSLNKIKLQKTTDHHTSSTQNENHGSPHDHQGLDNKTENFNFSFVHNKIGSQLSSENTQAHSEKRKSKFTPSFCNHQVKSIGDLKNTLNDPSNSF